MTYDHIRLTPEEEKEALREAREKKSFRIEEEERKARSQELRRQLTERWTPEKTKDWIYRRMGVVFPGEDIRFEDKSDEGGRMLCNAGSLFWLLCLYFSGDPGFVELAAGLGVKRPDLRKGILLCGPIGCGKTSLMKLFQRNQRQVYYMRSAKMISSQWREAKEMGGEFLETLARPFILPADDSQNFYQRHAGLCIDDAGTEDTVNSFGNKANVIGDLVEARYYNSSAGPLFHMTTNLTTASIKEFYGERVSSRLRESMNVIDYRGDDRRK